MQMNTEGTVQMLLSGLELRFPALKGLSYKISLNRELGRSDSQLKQGDEVALLPPFAGG
jgi:molybdopterin synthase sulfur carrier subunit